jgi:hypothetical protein
MRVGLLFVCFYIVLFGQEQSWLGCEWVWFTGVTVK